MAKFISDAEMAKMDAQSGRPKFISDDEMAKLEAQPKEEKGMIGQIFETIDSYTGAPTRASIGAMQEGKNPFPAFGKQFGEDPSLAPTGKQIAQKAGVPDTPFTVGTGDVAQFALGPLAHAIPYEQIGLPSQIEGTASGLAGGGIEMVADPTNLIPAVGPAAKALTKGGRAAARGLVHVAESPAAQRALGMLKNQVGAIGDIPETAGKLATKVDDAPKIAQTGEELARKGLINDTGERAARVELAGEKLGITPTRGMKSEDMIIRGLESDLEQTPSVFGSLVRRSTKKVRAGLGDTVEKMTAMRTNETAEQIGDGLKQSLTEKISARYAPIQEAYNSVRESTKNIEVSERSRKTVSRNIREYIDNDLVPGTPEADFVEAVAKKIESAKNANQIKTIKTVVGERLRNGPREQRYAIQPLIEKLERLEKNTIMREAIKIARTGEEGEAIGKGLIGTLKGANKDFRELITMLQDVGGRTKVSKSRTVSEFLDDLDDVNSMELADKLFKSKDTKVLNKIKTEFPEEFDMIRKLKIKEIYEASQVGEDIDARKFLKAIDKYEPEVQQLLFGKVFDAKNIPYEEAFDALRTLVNSWPAKMGPSGTPQGLDFKSLLDPAMYVRDTGRYALYRGRGSGPSREGLIRAGKSAQKATERGLITERGAAEAARTSEKK